MSKLVALGFSVVTLASGVTACAVDETTPKDSIDVHQRVDDLQARTSRGRTYYVDGDYAGTNFNGLAPTPQPNGDGPFWSTGQVNAVAATLQPMDRVLFNGTALDMAPQTYVGNLYLTQNGGSTPDQLIRVSSYNGVATIRTTAANTPGISVPNGRSGYEIDHLNFVGPATGFANGISIGIFFAIPDGVPPSLNPIRIHDVGVRDFNSGGIAVWASGKDNTIRYRDIRITNVDTRSNGGPGLQFWGPKPYRQIENVYVSHVNSLGNRMGAVWLEAVRGAVVEHSVGGNTWGNVTGGYGAVAFEVMQCDRVLLQYCEAYGTQANGVEGSGFALSDLGTRDSILQYNYSHGNSGPGIDGFGAGPGNTVRYNVTQNNGSRELNVWGAKDDVYNNVFFTNKNNPALFIEGAVGNRIRNNIFVNGGGHIARAKYGPSETILQGNVWYTKSGPLTFEWNFISGGTIYTGLPAFRAGTGQEKYNGGDTGFNVDPALASPGTAGTVGIENIDQLSVWLVGYRLRSTSPLKRPAYKGLNLPVLFGIAWDKHKFASDPFIGSSFNPKPLDLFGEAVPWGTANPTIGVDE